MNKKLQPIAIITRMAFANPLTEVQVRQFEHVFLQSLNNQSDKRFTLYILADKVRNYTGSDLNRATIESIANEFPKLDIVVGPAPRHVYEVEVRLDFDDAVSPGFVKLLRKYLQFERNHYKSHGDNTPEIISFKPIIVDSTNGTSYRHPTDYDYRCPSMCMALIQVKQDKPYGVYDRPHNLMAQHINSECTTIKEGYFFLHAHEENALTTIPTASFKIP